MEKELLEGADPVHDEHELIHEQKRRKGGFITMPFIIGTHFS